MTSLWLDGSAPITDDPLPVDHELDDLVVGAGLTGLTTALLLARAGRRVAVVEARHVGAVATGNTTAKISLLQGTHLSRILRHQSQRVAEAYVEGNREGMEWLLRFCGDHGVAVQRRPAVTYAAQQSERDTVEREHRAAASLGLPVRWEDRLDTPFPSYGATVLEEQAQFDPMDALRALVEQLRAHGGTLTQGLRVRRVSLTGRPTAHLDDGSELRADQLVLATGTPVLDRGLYFAKLEPQRSYGLAFEGVEAPAGMYLSAGSDSRSVRDVPRATGPLLLVGGSGHVVGRTRSELEHVDRLRRWTGKHFPGAHETHRWSAQDYGSHDGIPFLGSLPRGGGHIHLATGFEKWGMTNAVVAARVLSGEILGETPSWAKPLHRRITRPSGVAEILRTNLGVGLALGGGVAKAAAGLVPGHPHPERERAADCGVVGVCTHLGGVLKWNDAEASWDCPLHGSRFSAEGAVLEGPATRPLLRRSLGSGAVEPSAAAVNYPTSQRTCALRAWVLLTRRSPRKAPRCCFPLPAVPSAATSSTRSDVRRAMPVRSPSAPNPSPTNRTCSSRCGSSTSCTTAASTTPSATTSGIPSCCACAAPSRPGSSASCARRPGTSWPRSTTMSTSPTHCSRSWRRIPDHRWPRSSTATQLANTCWSTCASGARSSSRSPIHSRSCCRA